jgi:inosose dehydratase
MGSNMLTRRGFVGKTALIAGGILVDGHWIAGRYAESKGKLHVACNSYTWQTFYSRENRDFNAAPDVGFSEVARSGVDGYEPSIQSPADVDRLAPLLRKHGLEMRSIYVSSTLHKAEAVGASIDTILAIAQKAKSAGTRIIVTNPSPIQWAGPQNKDDAQLKIQAEALDRLGARLKELGLLLSYHNHDIELRNAAREFHHMMAGTDPKNVSLCLDAHWIYRGAGNSSVALFDVMKLYGSRISELHLRQSVNNIWSETLGEGDIDYPALARFLLTAGVRPHLVLEQAPEKGNPHTLGPVEAHRLSREYVDRVFGAFAS